METPDTSSSEPPQPEQKPPGETRRGFDTSCPRRDYFFPLLLVVAGTGLLLHEMHFPLPYWVFTWQMALIVVGLLLAITSGFRGGAWVALILIGSFFLLDEFLPDFGLRRFLWPVVLIAAGLSLFLKRDKWNKKGREWRRRTRGYDGRRTDYYYDRDWARRWRRDWNRYGKFSQWSDKYDDADNILDLTTVFGSVNKTVLSKDFKGGDVTIFMGGAELNLNQADIQGKAILDITQVFGSSKVIVPPNWEIRSELTTVFGSVEDKRTHKETPTPGKVLILDGAAVFGGIQITNY